MTHKTCRDQDPLLLTLAEVAKLLQVSQRTAWGLAKEGKLPSIRIGRCLRFPRRDIEAWIMRQSTKACGICCKCQENADERQET